LLSGSVSRVYRPLNGSIGLKIVPFVMVPHRMFISIFRHTYLMNKIVKCMLATDTLSAPAIILARKNWYSCAAVVKLDCKAYLPRVSVLRQEIEMNSTSVLLSETFTLLDSGKREQSFKTVLHPLISLFHGM